MAQVSVGDSGSRSKLTGKRKGIHDLCIITNDDAEKMAQKQHTSVANVYKVVSQLKKEGWLPADFTLRDRRGNSASNLDGRVEQSNINSQSHSDSHDNKEVAVATSIHPVKTSSSLGKRQEKSLRVKIWKRLKNKIPDDEIIMELDAEPEEFRREKAQYFRTIGCDSLVSLYEKKEEEIDALLELSENMQNESMTPSQFVGYQSYTLSLKHVKQELQREEENLDRNKNEIKDSESTLKLIKRDVDSSTIGRERLEKQEDELFEKSSKLKKTIEQLEKRGARLRNGISAMKKDHIYKKLMGYLTEDNKGADIINDEDFMDATVNVLSHWLSDTVRQSWIKKLMECQKNNNKNGASEIEKKLKEAWLLTYAFLYEKRNPTPFTFTSARASNDNHEKQYWQ